MATIRLSPYRVSLTAELVIEARGSGRRVYLALGTPDPRNTDRGVSEVPRVEILSGHRIVPNPGTMGGAPGALGPNSIRRNDGRIEILPGCAQTQVEAGEAIEIVTPTGGRWAAN